MTLTLSEQLISGFSFENESANKEKPLVANHIPPPTNKIANPKATIFTAKLSTAGVDFVIIFDETNTIHLIEFLKPDIITKASEYKIEDLDDVGGKFMKDNGKKVILIPYQNGLSTTSTIKKINNL